MQVWKSIGAIAAFSLAVFAQDVKLVRMPSVPASKILHREQPAYPADAADLHVQGIVKLAVLIGENGRVEDVKLISGHPLLAPAAMQAARRWVFEPFQSGDHAVRVETRIEIPFTLGSRQ